MPKEYHTRTSKCDQRYSYLSINHYSTNEASSAKSSSTLPSNNWFSNVIVGSEIQSSICFSSINTKRWPISKSPLSSLIYSKCSGAHASTKVITQ